MTKALLRNSWSPIVLAGTFILLDLLADRLGGCRTGIDLPHIALIGSVLLVSFVVVRRATETHRRAEASLRAARDDLERRVHERVAELESVDAALRRVNERLELTQAASGAGFWDWDIPSGRIEWSPRMFELFGLDMRTTAVSPDVWQSLLHLEDREEAERQIDLALETHGNLAIEYRTAQPDPDGRVRWISASGRGTYDEQGRPLRMSGLCLDITDQKLTELRIAHLASFPEMNPNPVLEFDASGKTAYRNPGSALALARGGLEDDARAFLPDDLPVILQALHQREESAFRREVQVGGSTFSETVHVIPALDVLRLYAFDVTDRGRAEQALRLSEEKYRLLFQNMAEGFALYELLYDEQGRPADWRVLEVNDAYTRHTGIARDRIVGRRASQLFPDAIPEYLSAFAEVVASQAPEVFETYAKAVGRHQRVFVFPAGEHRFATTIEDITDRKRAAEELALVDRERAVLEQRQHLARDLHDSVAQALYSISLGAHTALALLDSDRSGAVEALNYVISMARTGMDEMRAVVFELRPESLEVEGLVVALNRQMAALRARYGIEIGSSLCDEPAAELAVKEALYRIAQEALQNAIKHARADRLEICLTCKPGGVRLEVSDNGMGFDPQVFHPGHLGLQSMRERATGVGGALEILSEPALGTRVCVSVPVPAPETGQAD
jgi:PAS domain S-box-containing protein